MLPEQEKTDNLKLVPLTDLPRTRLFPHKVNYFMLREGQRYTRIVYTDILFIQSKQNYLKIHTVQKEYLVVGTMKQMEQLLPGELFFRIHRSFIIPLIQLERIDREAVLVNGKKYPLGVEYRKRLLYAMEFITFNTVGQVVGRNVDNTT